MDSISGHVMTLANSIIGVSILAMPYCFKQCGIILSIVMLLISSIISRLACHFLLKSAILARRKTFEFLAFHIFGGMGKFIIEIGMIGFLLGTCIAFFVVMGDLTPAIIGEMTGIYTTSTLRTSILMALALFAVLPLGLLRKVDSLNAVSRATIGFYCCLAMKVVSEAIPHIVLGDWYPNVNLWRTEGISQCLPIFSMALFCQSQLFEIYQAVQNATLEKMNHLVREAVNICTCVYILVGTFGYIAFADKNFTGNILLSFPASVLSDVMKVGFIISVIFSFPLVIFPCRASLYSLLYKEGYTSLHEASSNYIPEGKFKALTMFIVFVSLIIGIMIPNIELALGLIGSTIGVLICVIFPVTSFICISAKNTNERILAQIMLLVGLTVMVLGTYKNLYSLDQVQNIPALINNTPKTVDNDIRNKINFINELPNTIKAIEIKTEKIPLKNTDVLKEVRHEPPQPVEPFEEDQKLKSIEKLSVREKSLNEAKIINETKLEEVDIEAIKKQDKEEALQQENEIVKDIPHVALIDTIKKQNEVQKEIVEQQKKLIEVIQSQQKIKEDLDKDKVNEEKLRAVKEIKNIALRAIEKISGKEEGKNGNVPEDSTENSMKNSKLVEGNISGNKLERKINKPMVSGDNNILANIQKQVDIVVSNLKIDEDIKPDDLDHIAVKKTSDILHISDNIAQNEFKKPSDNSEMVEDIGQKAIKDPPENSQFTGAQNAVKKQSDNLSITDEVFQNVGNKLSDILEPKEDAGQGMIKNTIKNQPNNMKPFISTIEEKKKPVPSIVNLLTNKSNIAYNNTAPLLLKLGKVKEVSDSKGNFQLLPLPLVMSNTSHLGTNDTGVKLASKPSITPPVNDNDKILNSNTNEIQESQAMRRDILSLNSD